jgi:hypothetical protein
MCSMIEFMGQVSVADPGCFLPDTGSGCEHFSIRFPDPDPHIFHPGSYIKRGKKNKKTCDN